MNKIFSRIQTSSKWQLGLGAAVYAGLTPWLTSLGIDADSAANILNCLLVTIGAQAASDFGKEAK